MRRAVLPSVLLLLAACSTEDALLEELDALASAAAPCTTAADCCVVVDECSGNAWVVGAADYDEAGSTRDQLSDENCAKCMGPPPTELACFDGQCTGISLDREAEESRDAYGDHCGSVLETPPEGAGKRQLSCGD